jgi:hypothetical protein
MFKSTFLLTLFACLASCCSTHCMLSPYKFAPWQQPKNPELTAERKLMSTKLDNIDNITSKNLRQITDKAIVVRYATKQEQAKERTCFAYAVAQTSGYAGPVYLGTSNDQTSFNIEDFYEQTDKPQNNDMAVFASKQRYIKHFGCFRKDPANNHVIIESKWGGYPAIIQHEPFAVPHEYNKFLSFWRLKPAYSSPMGKLLFQKIIQVITNNDDKPLTKYKSPQSQVILKKPMIQ